MKTKILATIAIVLLWAGAASASPRCRNYAAADGGTDPETGISADALSGGVTYDSKLAGPMFDEFKIPRDERT